MREDRKKIRIRAFFFLGSLLIGWLIFLLSSVGSIAEGNTEESTEVPQQEIRQAVLQFLQSNHPWKTAEVRVTEVRIPGRVVLPTPLYDLSIRVPPNTRYLGRTSIEIIFNKGRLGQKRIWVRAYVEVLSPVVVTKRPLARNHVISADDVCLGNTDLAKVPPGVMTNVHEAVGLRLKQTLGVGAVLRGAQVEKPPIVKRGDVVKLLIETANMRITALGRVDERGGMGDTVRVINLGSNRRVYGEVVDSQTVRIRY